MRPFSPTRRLLSAANAKAIADRTVVSSGAAIETEDSVALETEGSVELEVEG